MKNDDVYKLGTSFIKYLTTYKTQYPTEELQSHFKSSVCITFALLLVELVTRLPEPAPENKEPEPAKRS